MEKDHGERNLRGRCRRFRLGFLGGDPAKRRRALANEVKFGWELHEQIDSDRIRLRRDRSCRERDDPSLGDPYRTYAVFK